MSHYSDLIEEDINKRTKAIEKAYPKAKIPDRRGRVVCYGDALNGYHATFHKSQDRRTGDCDRRQRDRRKK